MQSYDAYLFDWDGTLAQTLEPTIELVMEIAQRFGLQADREVIVKHFGDWKTPIYLGLPEEQLEQFVNEYKVAHARRMALPPLYDAVLPMLQELKRRGKKLALITSSYREMINAVLSHHEITELFDMIVTAGDVTEHKPHPEGILLTIEKLGVTKEKALMIGDSVKDLGAAENAGVDSLLFYPPTHRGLYGLEALQAYKPKYTVSSWEQLAAPEK